MTIALILKNAVAALFVDENISSNGPVVTKLKGHACFAPFGSEGSGCLRLEGAGSLDECFGKQFYSLSFGGKLNGAIYPWKKRSAEDPDYVGALGTDYELKVVGWKRRVKNKSFIWLQIRPQEEQLVAGTEASFI